MTSVILSPKFCELIYKLNLKSVGCAIQRYTLVKTWCAYNTLSEFNL
ncbi:hypothetical protein FDUTEX481_03044 [Tolypothrix sp. PCC 7601]|nr:hypothetical protein FDUTEX481_03044 [Tolypothrix sp. PCC 7601]